VLLWGSLRMSIVVGAPGNDDWWASIATLGPEAEKNFKEGCVTNRSQGTKGVWRVYFVG
jgi:hypothetical protein